MSTEQRTEASCNSKAGVFTVDAFANGIAFGQHSKEAESDPRDVYALRLQDDGEVVRLRSRYSLTKDKPLHQLERYLMKLSSRGVLHSSQIYLGTSTDPFHPFEGKFDVSIKFLELFKRYTPGMLTVQTRSPLIVLALPVFAALGKNVSVTIGIETPDESSVRRYTPGLPRVDERLKTAAALKRFGVEVTLQVGPVLPYGDWKEDAASFAALLNEHSDYIYVAPFSDGGDLAEKRIRNSAVAKRIADDRKFHWLRPDAATPLITEIEKIAPEKLRQPDRSQLKSKQLSIFAA
jgi:hypothetical protein